MAVKHLLEFTQISHIITESVSNSFTFLDAFCTPLRAIVQITGADHTCLKQWVVVVMANYYRGAGQECSTREIYDWCILAWEMRVIVSNL
jgi:hypothetical protein